jgi:hypothetical protein
MHMVRHHDISADAPPMSRPKFRPFSPKDCMWLIRRENRATSGDAARDEIHRKPAPNKVQPLQMRRVIHSDSPRRRSYLSKDVISFPLFTNHRPQRGQLHRPANRVGVAGVADPGGLR